MPFAISVAKWVVVIVGAVYVIASEFFDHRERMEKIEKNWPRFARALNNRPVRLLLLTFLIVLVMGDLAERAHVWLEPPLQITYFLPAPPVNETTLVVVSPTPTLEPTPVHSQPKEDNSVPAIQTWSKKELHDKVVEFAAAMRQFALDFSSNESTVTEQTMSEMRKLPQSDKDARDKLWAQKGREDIDRYKSFTSTIMKSYYQTGQSYRNELLRRLGPAKPSSLTAMGIFGESTPFTSVILPQSVLGSATELENLASELY